MRNPVVKTVFAVAACVPTLALAQRAPAAGAPAYLRQGSWELSVGAGGVYLDHQLQLLIQSGGVPSPGRVALGGVVRLGVNLGTQWNLSGGTLAGYGSSTTVLQPFGAVTWTPDINAKTGPFLLVGGGVTSIRWKGYRATSQFGVHGGIGLRQSLGDRVALRIEAREQYEGFQKAAAPKPVFNGTASVGLSWFLGGRRIPVVVVAVTPTAVTLPSIGATRQLAAAPRDARRRPLAGRAVAWSSSDDAVASVSADGVVTAVGNGTATITAQSERATGTARVTVAQVPAALSVSPSADTLTAVGRTVQLAASAQDANGNAIAQPEITWTSSNASVVTVSASGVATAVRNGAATITAAGGGVSAAATVIVAQLPTIVAVTPATATLSAVGRTIQLAAQVRDASGNAIVGATPAWTSDAPGVAAVSPAGLVTALANGTARIAATYQGIRGAAAVTVAVAAAAAPAPVAGPGPVALPTAVNARVVLPDVNFRPNSWRLPPEASAALEAVAAAMASMPDARWEIGGFTSSMGSRASNLRLSRLRALTVRGYLIRRGVPATQLTAVGYGPARPIASNATVAGRRQNMRVEIKRIR